MAAPTWDKSRRVLERHPELAGEEALAARAGYYGSDRDGDRAVAVLEEAAGLTPPRDPDRLTCLVNLGMALQGRHDLGGDAESLDRAITTGPSPRWGYIRWRLPLGRLLY